jgi:hypothetical protein
MKYTIERAYGIGRNGLDKQVGWDVVASDGFVVDRYTYLRDAKATLKACEREERFLEERRKAFDAQMGNPMEALKALTIR